jgi:hypothetical protein
MRHVLFVRISSEARSSEDLYPSSGRCRAFSEYTLDLPIGVATAGTDVLAAIAHGLLFDNDWTRDGTVSYWWLDVR